jgi:hypothetical protein
LLLAAQGLHGLTAQGLQGLAAWQGFAAAQGLHGLIGFLAAQGLQGLQAALAAQGLQGLQAAICTGRSVALAASGRATAPVETVATLSATRVFFSILLASNNVRSHQAVSWGLPREEKLSLCCAATQSAVNAGERTMRTTPINLESRSCDPLQLPVKMQ